MSTSTTTTTTHSFRHPTAAASSAFSSPPSSSSSASNIHTIHDKAHAPLAQQSQSHPVALVSAASLSAHLGRHSGSSSLPAWTSINGHVYDLTAFMDQHPGGDVIQLAAGREAAALIESYHGKSSMPRVYASLQNKCAYIGQLQGYQPPVGQQFFLTVQHRVDEFLRSRGQSYHTYEQWSVAESFITLALFLAASYYCCIQGSVLSAVCLGVLTARMGFLMHTGNHCASSSLHWLNHFIGLFMNIIGGSHFVWRHEHQVAHHLDPNELERDNDCAIGNPFIRMHPHLPPHSWQRWQHITVPIAISVGFIKW